MSFRCGGAIVLVLVAGSLCGRLPAEEAPRVPAWVVRDLETIRQAVGPVVDDSIFGDATEQGEAPSDFGRTYRRIASGDSNRPTPILDARPPMPSLDPQERYAAALRDAARLLELTAADLEDARHYDAADDLWRRVRELRRDARSILNPSSDDVYESLPSQTE